MQMENKHTNMRDSPLSHDAIVVEIPNNVDGVRHLLELTSVAYPTYFRGGATQLGDERQVHM